MSSIRFALAFILILSSTILSRPITFDDLYGIPQYSDLEISPDGERIAFTIKTSDLKAHTSSLQIWMMDVEGGNPKQLTYGDYDNWQPRWAADGEAIYYLSDQGEVTQIWKLSPVEGETGRMTSVPMGIDDYEYFPTGQIVFVSRIFPECHSDSCQARLLEAEENKDCEALLFDKLLFRHYNSWDDKRVNRLYLLDLQDNNIEELYAGGHDAPTSLLDGGRDFDLSPDGSEIIFSMSTDSIPAIWVNNELFRKELQGDGIDQLTNNPGLDVTPRYSPDGRYVAYGSSFRAGYESDQNDLILWDRGSGQKRNLTGDFDRSVGGFVWGSESDLIYFSAVEHGFDKIWKLDIISGKIDLVLGDAVYGEFQLSDDGSFLVLTRSLSHEPYEIYRFDLKDKRLRRLTYSTQSIVEQLDLTGADSFWFNGFQGDSIHGYLTLPPGFDAGKKYPLVLLIHGGPQWCWLGDFNYYGWNTQLTAAQGYVVAQIDPHGSVGYGLKFKEYVSGNWGKGDFEDLMIGLNYLIEKYDFIDTTRMAALGRSYGGFMANWICGHTDRFQCLISIDGSFNQVSGYGSTEELWFPEREFSGTPYDNPEEYLRASPLTYAKNFKTPTMVIHGAYDYRVDPSEGYQMFTALQRMGVPSQLLYFPDEGHSIKKLKNLRIVYERQFEWLERWLKK